MLLLWIIFGVISLAYFASGLWVWKLGWPKRQSSAEALLWIEIVLVLWIPLGLYVAALIHRLLW